jgi:hypothetical protein
MKTRRLIFLILCLGAAAARTSQGAPVLSTLQDATLQTLIDLGSTGVTVGSDQFYNFDFVAGAGNGPSTASQIQVEPFTNNGTGLQFVGSWLAADGTYASDVITYDVAATRTSEKPTWINLFSNGTAPAPATGTFTTATLTAQSTLGVPAGSVLSTYNDGATFPVDTTKPDVNFATTSFIPQGTLQITDAIFADSTAATASDNGGVATISVIQNSFGAVPEPSMMPWIGLAAVFLFIGAARRGQRMGSLPAMPGMGSLQSYRLG